MATANPATANLALQRLNKKNASQISFPRCFHLMDFPCLQESHRE